MKKILRTSLCLIAWCCAGNSIAESNNADPVSAVGRISFAGNIVTPTCKIINNQLRLTIDCPGSVRYSQKQALSETLGTHRTADGLSTISFKWLNRTRNAAIVTVTSV